MGGDIFGRQIVLYEILLIFQTPRNTLKTKYCMLDSYVVAVESGRTISSRISRYKFGQALDKRVAFYTAEKQTSRLRRCISMTIFLHYFPYGIPHNIREENRSPSRQPRRRARRACIFSSSGWETGEYLRPAHPARQKTCSAGWSDNAHFFSVQSQDSQPSRSCY